MRRKTCARQSHLASIPDLESMPLNGVIPLSDMRTGERGVVVGLDGGHRMCCRMASLGFTPGAEITVIQNFGRGPLIVRVREARIALGRGEAHKIHVRSKGE